MTPARHASLLGQAVTVWAVFWVLGWPDYYQQYSPTILGVGSTLLSVGISLWAVGALVPVAPAQRMNRALWLSLYFTVPLAALDTMYCGIYLGHGHEYLWRYWYLSVFYLTPWITLPPTAWLLGTGRGP